jgi:stage IV sporulation protein B
MQRNINSAKRKITPKFGVFLAAAVILCLTAAVIKPLLSAVNLPDKIVLTDTEWANEKPLPLNKYLTQKQNPATTVGGNDKKYITVKLLGIFPVKRVLVNILPFDTILVGGMPIGISGDIDGVLVTAGAGKLETGDIITEINGNEIKSEANFTEHTRDKRNLIITAQRGKKQIAAEIGSAADLQIRGTTNGVGILTFVNPQNNNFSALGHQMGDFETGAAVCLRGGTVKAVHIFGIDKTAGSKTGIIKSSLRSNTPVQGSVIRGDKFGVAGCLTAESEILKQCITTMPVATRYNVRAGAAVLRTSLDGVTVEEFECEILKTRYQNKKKDKSMVIRITDRGMLARTGGILHGMSGSPIIQNGKLVGVLTHATTSDPAKGYAVYIDFVTV